MTRARIVGVGAHLPAHCLTNADLERMVDTTDEWIVSRTGIRERRMIGADEATSDMAIKAARIALEDAGMEPSALDLILVATASPDQLMPSTASRVQAGIGAACGACDVNAACSGFVYALHQGVVAIEAGRAQRVLVIGADALTRYLDFEDRTTCVLFGDGAGAVVIEGGDEPGVLGMDLGCDGTGADVLGIPAGGSAAPCSAAVLDERSQYLRMNGSEVFKFAVRIMPETTLRSLDASGLTVDDVAWFVPHQANKRITDTMATRLGVPVERVMSTIAYTGNTSAASIPLALHDLYTGGQLHPGDVLVLAGFGAGLTWGSAVVRWTKESCR